MSDLLKAVRQQIDEALEEYHRDFNFMVMVDIVGVDRLTPSQIARYTRCRERFLNEQRTGDEAV